MKLNRKAVLGVALLASAAWLGGSRPASATLQVQKAAKDAGFEATNCMYCHGEKLPKKGSQTYNERGKWLLAEKEKHQAKEVDVKWLKDYKPAEEKK